MFHSRHVNWAQMLGCIQVFVQGVARVNRLKFLGCIFAGVFKDYFLTAGVFYALLVST